MISPVVLYEYPFNERVRTYLRLERLFGRLAELIQRDTPIDHHQALTTFFEILDVAARADLKTDALKDLEKQKQILNAYRGNPSVMADRLDAAIAELDGCFRNLNAINGKVGQSLADNEWLMSVRSRAIIPGGTCEFDVPAYHAWQHRDANARRANLGDWRAVLLPLSDAIDLLLRLLRQSGQAQQVMALNGHFQQSLPQGRTFQLLRLRVDRALDLVPEISGNRLMISVRLVRIGDDFKLAGSHDEARLELTLCA